MEFEGKTVLVTGAAGGIGAQTCRQFVQQGATVVAVDRSRVGLSELQSELGNSLRIAECDLSDEQAIATLQRDLADLTLDVLVNNAGVGKFADYDFSAEDFDWHFHINTRAPMFMVKYFRENLQRSAAPNIVNIASVAARMEWANHFLYSTAKAALEKFTYHLVKDLPWLRANAILPGVIDTAILSGFEDMDLDELRAYLAAEIPCKRIGEPADIANAVIFLSSDKASYINGASLIIDGGVMHSNTWVGL